MEAGAVRCYHETVNCLNFGDALNPLAVCIMIAHFAPQSCKGYKDSKQYKSIFCKIDRNNPCMRMFDWILAKSLHREAGGEWTDATKQAVSERISIVDAKVLITEDTDGHASEFRTFCHDNDISMDEMDLIGFLLYSFHVKHHDIGGSDSLLYVLVTSAAVYDALFSKCQMWVLRHELDSFSRLLSAWPSVGNKDLEESYVP